MGFGSSRRLGPIARGVITSFLLWPVPALAQSEIAAAVGLPNTAPQAAPAGEPLAGDAVRTRFLIGLEKSVVFQVFSLNNPNRVVVELPEVKLELPPEPKGEAVGLVQSFRGGLAAPGKTRVVIDVTEPVIVESAKIEQGARGHRLALEIVPVEGAKVKDRKAFKSQPFALGAAGLQPPMARPAQRPADKAAKAFRPVIVLDPGHGGHDSGAKKNGAIEKDVVLAMGILMREKLEKSGRYKVLMTRDTDKFVELSERVDYAERNKASLFIAIHCDYAGARARGATIYSLREGQAESLKRSAKGEVSENVLTGDELAQLKKTDASDVDPVRNMLADLAQREVETTKERTSMFTRAVVENMSETTAMRDDPNMTAGFRVLKTAQFPSVLIELAYVTNKEDAAHLLSDKWRDKVSDSIITAIDNYFSNMKLPM